MRPMDQLEHHPSPETGGHHWLPNFKTFKIVREGKQIKSTLNTPFFIFFFPEIVPIFLLFSSSSLLINKSNILQKAKVIPALLKDSNMTSQPQLSSCKTLFCWPEKDANLHAQISFEHPCLVTPTVIPLIARCSWNTA